ncbi:MAG: serine O-acetyltransferase [Gammaproteobacteria bacterium]
MSDLLNQPGMPRLVPMERVSLGETLRRIRIDYRRVCEVMGAKSFSRRLFWMLSPNVVSLTLYRISHLFYTNHLRPLAWPVYLINLYLTSADIPPSSVIGERCFLGHAAGTIICGVVGRDAMLFCSPAIGGGMGQPEEGRPANGLPVIGDGVMVGARAIILGPIFIGDGATVAAGVTVLKDMEPHSTAVGRPPQMVKTRERSIDYDAVAGLK